MTINNVSRPAMMNADQLLQAGMNMGGGADLALTIYAMQIKKADQSVNDALKQIQQRSKLRDAISKQMAKHRNLLAKMQEVNDKLGDDKGHSREHLMNDHAKKLGVDITWDSDKYDNDPKYRQTWDAVARDFQNEYGIFPEKFRLDENGQVQGTRQKDMLWKDKITDKEVETLINNDKDKVAEIDSDREIRMILLNQMLNQKGNMVNQLTNIIKKTHDTQQSVITNLR
jgi:hypothetical protein